MTTHDIQLIYGSLPKIPLPERTRLASITGQRERYILFAITELHHSCNNAVFGETFSWALVPLGRDE
jgi:hypothetical protein